MSWPCFWIEPARPFVEFLTICPDGHRVVHEVKDGADFHEVTEPDNPFPAACPECDRDMDYERPRDEGGATGSRMGGQIWRNPATSEEHRNQHEHGPGAMFECADWAVGARPHEDGRCLAVVLPPGGFGDTWMIDTPASTGSYWERTAVPDTSDLSTLTVTPSILTPNYHSFLTGGVLGDSLPDRPLPAEA